MVAECISAARMALEIVDDIVGDGLLFHAFWWTPYATFCALAVVYVWEIQQKAHGGDVSDDPSLFELAERCHGHLSQSAATHSPGPRYSIILEELRLEARQGSVQSAHQVGYTNGRSMAQEDDLNTAHNSSTMSLDLSQMMNEVSTAPMPPLNEWQAIDWLDLDSSVLSPHILEWTDFECHC